MVISSAMRGFELQWGAFDVVDSKSSGIIGFVTLAGALLGFFAVQKGQSAAAVTLTCLALLLFALGIGCALKALWPRDTDLLPSATATLARLEECGPEETLAAFVLSVEEGQDIVHDLTNTKCVWLCWAYGWVAAGFGAVIVATLVNALTSSPPG